MRASRTVYPVRLGDHWRVGIHEVACLDTISGTFTRWLRRTSPPPKMVYTDPPWNNAALRSSYTAAGHLERPDFARLIQAITAAAADLQAPLWIETGRRSEGHVRTLIGLSGGHWQGSVPIVYHKVNPCLLLLGTFTDHSYTPSQSFTGLDDNDAPLAVFRDALQRGRLNQGDTVLDPCCGAGGATARGALANRLRFVGSELSPGSVSTTLTMLAHETGSEPECLGMAG